MLVYGYTRDLETVPVELSIRRIVKAGIDPWRLDLFDPDPIALRVDGKRLFFRRLGNLSFAYRKKGGDPLLVGMHDGTAGVCFYGRHEEANFCTVQLKGFEIAGKPFTYHFAEYLHEVTADERSPYLNFGCITHASQITRVIEKHDEVLYTTKPAGAVQIQGDTLLFDTEAKFPPDGTSSVDRMHPLCLTGKMMNELTVPSLLRPEVNWLLTLLEQYHPVVHGGAVIKSILGKDARRVEFMIPREAVQPIKQWLQQFSSGGTKLRNANGNLSHITLNNVRGAERMVDFEIAGHRYFGRPDLDNDGSPISAFFDDGNRFSPECLFSREPNSVSGPGIAIFDAGARQARPLYANGSFGVSYSDQQTRLGRAFELEVDGIEILEPWGCEELKRRMDERIADRRSRNRVKIRKFLKDNFEKMRAEETR